MKKKALKRKSFLPALVVALLAWLGWGLVVWKLKPAGLAFGIFYCLLFITVWFTFSLILANSWRGFLISLGIIVGLFLRQIGVGNWFNILLLAGILISFEVYLSGR